VRLSLSVAWLFLKLWFLGFIGPLPPLLAAVRTHRLHLASSLLLASMGDSDFTLVGESLLVFGLGDTNFSRFREPA
jgi:hypothetical protein